jgi:hypothetical protein
MNEVDWLKSLDRATPHPTTIDVTEAVMRVARSTPRNPDAVFSIGAVVAAVAGVAAIALAVPWWVATQDPLACFAEAFDLVLQ